jgi:hypothetical protein
MFGQFMQSSYSEHQRRRLPKEIQPSHAEEKDRVEEEKVELKRRLAELEFRPNG